MPTKSPLQSALGILKRIRRLTDRVLVGFSGGKDSWVTTSLAIEVFGETHVQPYFMYFLPGLECEEQQLQRFAARYPRCPPVLRLPHFGAIEALRSGTYCSPRSISRLTPKDTERLVRSRSGIEWILLGHRLTDSLHRRGLLTRCQGIESKWKRAYPIYEWHPQDALHYLEDKGIPLPPSFGSGRHQTSNVGLTFECLLFLRKEYPQDYSKILRVFPKAEQIIQREEVRARHNIFYDPLGADKKD